MKHKKHKISTQLSAGFAVIVLITISVISLTANLLISHQFEKYVARQRETFAEQLITTLLSQHNSSNRDLEPGLYPWCGNVCFKRRIYHQSV